MNSDDHSHSLIPRPDAALATEAGRVLPEMVGETLTLARREPIFKIGEYEWCEPDYRQILIWAEDLAMEPEEVIRLLRDESISSPKQEVGADLDNDLIEQTAFREGRLASLRWNLALLPVAVFRWVDGLEIEALTIWTPQEGVNRMLHLQLSLPRLRMLHCGEIGIEQLDLSRVPQLEEIWCDHNRLTTIDLSKVPLLRVLYCSGNALEEIDVSGVTSLEQLECKCNRLMDLNVSRAASLKHLDCSDNRLRHLDLKDKYELASLDCGGNLMERLCVAETALDVHGFRHDGWVYVFNDNGSNGDTGFFPKVVFDQLRLDKTQPEAAYPDWEAYLNSHGYTSRPREQRP